MSFTFIHTADWQIGKPFGGFDERLAGRLEEARLDVIDRIADVANEHKARHVLVAGDVYDAPHLKERTLRQPLSRMAAHNGITWVLLPGNHDPAQPGGVWERVRRIIGGAANIVIADTPAPLLLETGVIVLPAPLTAKSMSSDPTAWMDGAGPFDGVRRIGLAHGAVHGFGAEGECAVPLDPDRVTGAKLDYLALGDWHGMKEITPRCWYAGTPEPDNFTKNAKGFALVVMLPADGSAPVVKPVGTGRYVWSRVRRRITSAAEFAALEREIPEISDAANRLLLRLDLEGALTPGDHAALDVWRGELDGRLQYLDIDTDALELSGGIDDPAVRDLIGGDGELAAVAARLDQLARAGEGEMEKGQRAVARTALLRLLALARRAGEAAS